jgi:hypothetical protein
LNLTAPSQLNLIRLASRVQPQPSELASAELHQGSVKTRLSTSFAVASTLRIGSHARSTAIRWHSDLDLMVTLKIEECMWGGKLVSSTTVLDRVVADLRERYPKTSIRRDVLAVALDFGSSKQSLEVVPAMFHSFCAGRPVYLIPDGDGDWLKTSPAVHDRLFSQAHLRSGNKLCRVSQLIKWWKFGRQQPIPISSFYTDMLLVDQEICVGVKSYGQCLKDFFAYLVLSKCRAVEDPCGVAGQISCTKTAAQRGALYLSAEYAYTHARAAMEAEQHRQFVEANRQWDLVFNGTYLAV